MSLALPTTSGKLFLPKKPGAPFTVLYFYPKDHTSGCTREGHDFAALHQKFRKLGAQVFGVSRDSLASHEKFKAKHDFPFELVSDEDEALCKVFDTIHEKNMYGRKVLGIVRSTFLLDAKGKTLREWRKVKVDGHAEEVLAALEELS